MMLLLLLMWLGKVGMAGRKSVAFVERSIIYFGTVDAEFDDWSIFYD